MYEPDTVWGTPDLLQSLSDHIQSQKAVPTGNNDPRLLNTKASSLDGQEARQSSMLLQVRAFADYFTHEAALMREPPPVLVDLILDPYIYNVVPQSLLSTVGYITTIAIITWFVAQSIASRLQSIAAGGIESKRE